MNNINDLNDLVSQLSQLSPAALTVLVVILIGYCIRVMKSVENTVIPIVCLVAGAVVYSHLAPPSVQIHPGFHDAIIGAVLGWLAWTLHDKLISQFEDKIPLLKDLLSAVDQEPPTPQVRIVTRPPATQTDVPRPGDGTAGLLKP